MVTDRYRFQLREAAKGFIISFRASSCHKSTYLETLERTIAYLCEYAENNDWPTVFEITTADLEEYLTYLQDRSRWFGEGHKQRIPAKSLSLVLRPFTDASRDFGTGCSSADTPRSTPLISYLTQRSIRRSCLPSVSES